METAPESSDLMTANSRHPFQTFMMVLCLLTGLPIVFGNAPAPASMESVLNPLILLFWGAALTIGGALSLLGSLLRRRLSGLLIEQVGLVFVGVAAILYSVVLALVVGLDKGAAYPAAITFAFGASCLWRWRQIQKFLTSLTNHRTSLGTAEKVSEQE